MSRDKNEILQRHTESNDEEIYEEEQYDELDEENDEELE